MAEPASEREDVRFPSDDGACAGWLYRAGGATPGTGCVVLAHGLGAVKEGGLDAYAERFAGAGLNALVFDYRHFGASDGEPRQLLSIARQHADWRAAISQARALEGIDPERIALWGTSLSGGHVMAVSAADERIAAVVSQVPLANGLAALRSVGPRNLAATTLTGVADALGSLAGAGPRTVPIVGPPGSVAAMTADDAERGYARLYPEGFRWRNEVLARSLLALPAYNPGRRARDIRCPLLVQVADRDSITPPGPARRAAAAAPRGEVREYPGRHFDAYVGELFERMVDDQLGFLRHHLLDG